MLPRHYRLPATSKLTNYFVYTSPFFVARYVQTDLPLSRFGFVIGKVVAKNAVDRNRAKRVLRSCIEERLTSIASGYDMLFLLKKGIIGVDREIIVNEVQLLLQKRGLLK